MAKPGSRQTAPDRMAHIRVYLEKKSKDDLVNLLLDMVQDMDEPTRQQFWERLAPPGMATADLRYPTAADFLAELEDFVEKVAEGEYYDEEAAIYYGDDNYYAYEEYELDRHAGLNALKVFFHESDSYFDAGQFDVARQSYALLLGVVLDETFDTLGLPDPLNLLGQDERQVVNRYLVALHASQPLEEFFTQALSFFYGYENPTDVERFLELTGSANQPALQAHLETWADQHAQINFPAPLYGFPLPLRLLLRFYEQDERSEAIRAIWNRFRHLYPYCYEPLLADRQNAKDWHAVIAYAQEALSIAPALRPGYYVRETWAGPDRLTLRGYLARAYSATGETEKAFELYRPALDENPSFETYSQARQLADAISKERGQAFSDEVVGWLLQKGETRRYLLCQVYLNDNRFDEAYALVENLDGYQGMEESKLVAKAHLLAAFGSEPDELMGSNLRDLYAKVAQGDNEPLRFLREALPHRPGVPRSTAIQRAQRIYERLMQTHIDNGRKTYATAAYYCALLGEIFVHEDRLTVFREWYNELMEAYKRFRALRAEMEMKVGPVLKSAG